jgi:hypothetical protein
MLLFGVLEYIHGFVAMTVSTYFPDLKVAPLEFAKNIAILAKI